MPWEQHGGGYTRKHARRGRGGFVTNPDQYEALRRKGMSKERAAAITNAHGGSVSKSAFGVDHTISKHYLGGHGPDASHTRRQHGELRAAKKATRRSYNTAAGEVWRAAHDQHVNAHPVSHAAERTFRAVSGAAYPTRAEIAGNKAHQSWEHSDAGRHAAGVRDTARGAWNPRYERKRKARATAGAAMMPAIAKSAFGVEHTVSKAGDLDAPKTAANASQTSGGRVAGTLFGAGFRSPAATKKQPKKPANPTTQVS